MTKEYRVIDPGDVPSWAAIKAAADFEPDNRVVIRYWGASPLAISEVADIPGQVVSPYTIKDATDGSFTIALESDL